MHNDNSLFLKELRQFLNNARLKEDSPSMMLGEVYGEYGPQTSYEFSRLVLEILQGFGHESEGWYYDCQLFFSTERGKIEFS